MLRDVNLYMTIPHSISNLDLKVPSGCRSAFKSALLACCCALKVPFPGTFTMPFWGAGGNTNWTWYFDTHDSRYSLGTLQYVSHKDINVFTEKKKITYLRIDARKLSLPSKACDQVTLKPACSATETCVEIDV